MSGPALPPLSADLVARLRAAAAAASPSEARTWLPAAPPAVTILRNVIRAMCPPIFGWCRQA